MAYGFGQGIQAGLGAVDYSPIARGGQMAAQGVMQGAQSMAQGIAALGQGIGQGMQQYQMNKQKVATMEGVIKAATQSNPELFKSLDPKTMKLAEKLRDEGTLAMKDMQTLYSNVTTLDTMQKEQQKANLEQMLMRAQIQGLTKPPAPPAAPSGYRWADETQASLAPIPGGPADKPAATQQPAPTGYRYTDQGALEPIPGGPAELEIKAKADAAKVKAEEAAKESEKAAAIMAEDEKRRKNAIESARADLNLIQENISRASQLIAGGAGGLEASISQFIPGSQADQLSIIYNQIQSNIALANLAALKAQSSTGASGLGQQSEKELKVLMDKFGTLKVSANPAQQLEVLNDVSKQLDGIFSRLSGEEVTREQRGKPKPESMPKTIGRFKILSVN